ncbi:MAG: hypothetical protein COU32_01400 [Candidatus Magasanikbacteria bacterium CG10_big_fil_rev_8_21_14_0_10_42_10]|uniref:SWIM-type domain-containing protein n=2 Tax=Candidatus Magasanikiibacteriota TaxID=1752731 RepID=A0A2H0TYS9_9BACT|nr:MAG: hypothetical protein COU32_01400 [Candidatus Magasanikbacteria bacterium CG10_big_fil_rev_8_21_14_0_10_42_10]PIZ92688.1 MAG: hypothetical protein COX82_04330 [Candidatus Magasanikbacteria bacterium CG_4_10_14_0_2_um_filter_41_10]
MKSLLSNQLKRKREKAKKYSSEPERFSIKENLVTVVSDHGIRTLQKIDEAWICDCDFFSKYATCSHVIATVEHISKHAQL